MEREGRYGGGQGGYSRGPGGDRDRREDRRPAKSTPGKIFVGGLSPDTNQEALQSYCAQWGPLSGTHVMMGKNYGFVTFENPKDAAKFLETREHVINGRQVDAKAAVPKDQGGGRLTKKMFVGGTIDLTDNDFRDYFSRFGRIEDASILRKPDGSSRGYGFVTYEDEMSVEKCLVQEHNINGQDLDCKRALAKDPHHGPPGGRGPPGAGGGFGHGGGDGGSMMGNMPMMGMMGGPGMAMMPMMGMGGMMGGGNDGGGRGPKHPEWTCNECGNTNFAWRHYCNKCKRPGGGGGGGGGMGGGGGRGSGGMGGGMNMMGGGMPPGAMMMGGGGPAGMANMAAMQMPMGMMGAMNPMAMNSALGGGMGGMGPGMNMMGGGAGGAMGGMGGGMMGPGMGGAMGMMQGMGGSGMGGGNMMGGGGGGGGQGGGFGRMGGNNRGNANGQARFRPY